MFLRHLKTDRKQITAKDIVGGHRQRTLALLWKIISHWQIPALVDVAELKLEIQRIRDAIQAKVPKHFLLFFCLPCSLVM